MSFKLLPKRFLFIALAALPLLQSCGSDKPKSHTQPSDIANDSVVPAKTEVKEDRPSPLKLTTGMIGKTTVAIWYGSPAVKGRQVWGSLVPYNEVWRTGANEATNIEFGKDVVIEGQPLKAGRYSIFTIPTATEWTVIFNSVWEQWGAYDYDASKDILRVNVTPQTMAEPVERLDYMIENDGVAVVWEKLKVKFKVAGQ